MPGMGPPPNPNARRRNARPASMTLPAAGRKGSIPKWPLLPDLNLKVQLQMAESVVEDLSSRDDLSVAEKRKLARATETFIKLTHKVENVEEVETQLWSELWRTPQAVAWEKLGYNREVAQYCRFKVYAEWGDMDAAKESRQMSDRLGLSPLAMLRLQWVIDEVPAPAKAGPDARAKVTDISSRRDRITG